MSTTAERLAAYQAAELKILAGQAVQWGDRSLTRADLKEVRDAIKDLQSQIASETRAASGGGTTSVALADFRGCE